MFVSFAGFTPTEVLKLLWENTNFQGFNKDLVLKNTTLFNSQIFDFELDDQLNKNLYVDYFKGKPIKVDFSTFPNLDPTLYDRDAGENMMNNIKEILVKNNLN